MQCPMWNSSVKIEENIPGTFPQTISHLFFIEIRQYFSIKNSRSNDSFDSNRTTFPIPEREKKQNHYLFCSDKRSNTSWHCNIHIRPHWGFHIIVINIRFVSCILIHMRMFILWLEELQELRWKSNPFHFLIIVQQTRNPLEINFPEQEIFIQNTFDCTLANAQNASNPFLWKIYIIGQSRTNCVKMFDWARITWSGSSLKLCSHSSKRCIYFWMALSPMTHAPETESISWEISDWEGFSTRENEWRRRFRVT
jgi:hypothetical protein